MSEWVRIFSCEMVRGVRLVMCVVGDEEEKSDDWGMGGEVRSAEEDVLESHRVDSYIAVSSRSIPSVPPPS